MAFNIGDLFYQWEAVGVFEFVLPFLLLFAVVFGVLTATHIMGGNKGVNVVIALSVSLLSLRVGMVQDFFRELFPRFGVGLAMLIIVVILVGLFIPKEHMKGWLIGLGVFGVVIGIGVLIATFYNLNWFGSYFWQDYWGIVVGGVVLVILIIFMAISPIKGEAKFEIPIPKFR
tara:strand:- start:3688 stop:4206 length:519 start_codon:yes stop_codon:yes gene_type:complete